MDDIYLDSAFLSKQQRVQMIIERDGDFCYICKKDFSKKDKRTIDHWIPLSKGGTWSLENLRLAHKKCNAWKSNRVPNKDGTIPPPPKKERIAKKKNKPIICNICQAGRSLSSGEVCVSCGSGPEPKDFPRWAKRHIRECDHKIYFCFGCTIGFIERVPIYRLDSNGT